MVRSSIIFSNGQIDLSGFYKNGNKTGLWIYYGEDGAKKKEIYYKNGKLLEGKELELYLKQLKAKKDKLKSE